MDPIVLFFAFGFVAGVFKSNIGLSKQINDFLSFFLLFVIGLKGGVELYGQNILSLTPTFLVVASIGVAIPLFAYPVLKFVGRFGKVDAASIAAHYGSVSVGTFAVCVAYLNNNNVFFEPYVPIFVVILEVPAILIGLTLAKGIHGQDFFSKTLSEISKSSAVFLLLGGLVIGALVGKTALAPFLPFFFDLFYGVLALFLIEMGLTVSRQLEALKKAGWFLIGFGLSMPLVCGVAALGLGYALNLSLGGQVVLSTLAASASYIAVPAAMRMSLPEANLSLPLGSSLGVTFPFNVLFGIPLFYKLALYMS